MADGSDEGVDFTKRAPESAEPVSDPAGEVPFDPYRFGKPEHPIPAEYAPPGYEGPTIPTPSGPGYPYASPTDSPFGNPPGTPYGQYPPHYGAPYGGPPGSPPPHYPYGAPPPPPYNPYPQPHTGNGKAVAGLVLGIASIVLCVLAIFDVPVILGIVFSTIALNETKGRPGNGRGMAMAGLVCSIIGALLATIMTVAYVRLGNTCSGVQDNRSEFQTCVRHHLF